MGARTGDHDDKATGDIDHFQLRVVVLKTVNVDGSEALPRCKDNDGYYVTATRPGI